jgi:hypothetical protein
MNPCLDSIRPCLEGAIPAVIATCDADGTPNVTYVSQVHYVDRGHVALSFQFFNKTRQNVLANPQVTVFVIHPATAARYRLALLYRRTETEGPLFESMKARLAGIASQTGMGGVFRLRGADVYQVLDIEHVPGAEAAAPEGGRNHLAALRRIAAGVSACTDLAGLLETTLEGLEQQLGIRHAMILFADTPRATLYTVASRGYTHSGIGSEFPLGHGLIGVAAAQRTPILITHMASEYAYSQAVREHAASVGLGDLLETAIPFPGLASPHSQVSVPILAAGRLLGVLHVESPQVRAFGYDDEDALVGVASLLGAAILSLQQAAECHAEAARPAQEAPASGIPLLVKRYASNDSVFLGEDYLIKGVAGAIFWRLLTLYTQEGRTEFTNRELRLDPALKLPDIDDNLEARLILLQRRLAERQGDVVLEKTGRGRFRLALKRPVQLLDMPAR